MGAKISLIVGQRFGRLVILEEVGKSRKGHYLWKCLCDCGNIKIVRGSTLKSGATQSCGCLQKEKILESITKHGMCNTSTYTSWQGMFCRCNNSDRECYKNYGGRGITVCKRWNKFENFFADMDFRPEGLTLERIDNNKGYTIGNVVPCCKICNHAKNNLTIQEFKDWIERVSNKMLSI